MAGGPGLARGVVLSNEVVDVLEVLDARGEFFNIGHKFVELGQVVKIVEVHSGCHTNDGSESE